MTIVYAMFVGGLLRFMLYFVLNLAEYTNK